jgi:hypothetical protein
MRRLCAFGLVVAVALSGCGASQDHAFDTSLIRQVGAGSNALASAVPTIRAQLQRSGDSFSDPRDNKSVALLAQGQLAKLSQSDLVTLANENRRGAAQFQVALRKLDALATSIASARVPPDAHRTLSSGAQKFIAAWNMYLTTVAGQVRSVRRIFSRLQPESNAFQTLLRAAYETATSHSTVQFDRAHDRYFSDILPQQARARKAMTAALAQPAAARQFSYLVDHSHAAVAIVMQVNGKYPNGYLAQQAASH